MLPPIDPREHTEKPATGPQCANHSCDRRATVRLQTVTHNGAGASSTPYCDSCSRAARKAWVESEDRREGDQITVKAV
jgi:hypothetical protein